MEVKIRTRKQTYVQNNIEHILVMPFGLCKKIDLNFKEGLMELTLDLNKFSNYNAALLYPDMLTSGLHILNGGSNSRE